MVQKVTSSALQRLLHENWNPVLTKAMQLSAPESNLFKWKVEKPEGKWWEETQQTSGNAYLAARSEDEWSPGYDPGAQYDDAISGIETQTAKYLVKTLEQAVNFTALAKAITNSTRTGFENLAKLKIKDVSDNLNMMVSLRLAGTALGSVFKIKSVDTATGIVEVYDMSVNIPEGGNRAVKPGHVYDATAAGRATALRTAGAGDRGRRVTAVGRNLVAAGAYPTITFNSLTGCTWADGDYGVMFNTRALANSGGTNDGSVNSADDWQNLKNPWGIQDVADDGTKCPYIGGVTRSTNPTYKAIVLDTGVLHTATPDEVNQLCEMVDTETDGMLDWFYVHPSHRRFMMQFVTATVGYSGTSAADPSRGVAQQNLTRLSNTGMKKLTFGYGDMSIQTIGPNGEMGFKTSRLAPMHEIIGIKDDIMKTLVLKEPGFVSDDGQTVRKAYGKGTFYADWNMFTGGVVCEKHWNLGVIRSVKGSPMEAVGS